MSRLCHRAIGIDTNRGSRRILVQRRLARYLIGVLERFNEYENLGVSSIIQMDPVKRITRIFRNGDLLKTDLERLEAGGRSIPFDTKAIFAEMDE